MTTNGSTPLVQDNRIAIVGIGCHFPGGATDPDEFWNLLASGTDATRQIPNDRWEVKKFYDPDPNKIGKTHVSRGGFLERVDQFDAQFFGISPREAVWLDPQQRLMMRVTYESIEDAGLDLNQLSGTDVGVFVGGFTLDYQLLQNYGVQSRYELQSHSATGMMMTMLSNRLSHAFNFTGPSMSIDSACSSSLVAVHLATQSILRGECPLALAGGVNVMLTPNMTIAESKGGFLSPDGRCKTFDSRADGYARAEGAGVVVLKPLAKAQADNDPIYAVIMGTAVSQDGRTDGITVPNGEAQQRAIRAAQAMAGVRPAQIQYVEAHGTGTPVGDPIEARAIGASLSDQRNDDEPIMLGSVKTNIGHLEAAAGVAGLIKTSLALSRRQIPPHLNLLTPNPDVPLSEYNLQIPTDLTDWPTPADGPRLAGVNSFGFGGTNAHVVLAEAPPRSTPAALAINDLNGPFLLPLSARTPEALAQLAARLADRLRDADISTLTDVCRTSALRRTHHNHRAVVIARSADEAVDRLTALANNQGTEGTVTGTSVSGPHKLAFVCTGMGPQWWAMGRRLLCSEPIFRAEVERCSAELEKYTGWSLVEELLCNEDSSRMGETEVAQPANFAVQVGLAALWKERGVEPDAVIGHSTGELAAQYLSGVMSLSEAIRVAYHRSHLQQRCTGTGRMLAVGLSPETLDKAVSEAGPGVSVAAVNSGSAVTMSGDSAALEKMASQLETFGVFHKFLQVEVPYHSHLMDPIRDELLAELGDLATTSAVIPLYSTVTGTRIDGRAINAQYWWQNVRATVLFGAAFSEMITDGYTHFIELGPHTVLANSMREVLDENGAEGVVVPSMLRGADDETTFHASLAALHCHGYQLPWDELSPPGAFVDLPRYPWQLKRFWNESAEAAEDRHLAIVHPLLGQRINATHPTWETEIGQGWLPGIADHRIQETTLVPAAALIEMMHAAANDAYIAGTYRVQDLQLLRAIALDGTNDPRLRTTLWPDTGHIEIASFRALPNGDRSWTVHATARIGRLTSRQSDPVPVPEPPIETGISGTEFYTRLATAGFQYGPDYQTISEIRTDADRIEATIDLPVTVVDQLDDYRCHPVFLDGALQTLLIRGIAEGENQVGPVLLPVGVDSVCIHRRPSSVAHASVRITSASEDEITCDVSLRDSAGNSLVDIVGYTARSLEATTGASPEMLQQSLYCLEWEPVAAEAENPFGGSEFAGSTVAIFADRRGVGDALASRWARAGEAAIKVLPDEVGELTADSPDSYRLDPTDPVQYRELAKLLGERGVDHVVHLWSNDISDTTDLDGRDMLAQQRLATSSVFHLVQALTGDETTEDDTSRASAGHPTWRLWLVTRHGQSVLSNEAPSPTQAALWGFGRVIGHQELPNSWGGLIDIDGAEVEIDAAQVWQTMASGADDHTAYRNGQRYLARLDQIPREGIAFPVELDSNASYLITGGFGALGLVVARYLAEHGAQNVILMGRSGVPAREEWADLSTDHPHWAAVHEIQSLESETGCSVQTAVVDVADVKQLQKWYERLDGPPLRGVVHTAGIVDDALVQRMSSEQFHRVLVPKISGAWNLHRLLSGDDLDFFTLFSSTGAVIASPGQVNYASGNAFLDALAQFRRAHGLPAVSLGWGPWSIGMVKQLNLEQLYSRLGIDLISPELAEAVLSRYLIDPDTAHAIVITADWATARRASPTGEMPPLYQRLDGQTDGASNESLVEQLLATPVEEREKHIATALQEIIATILALDSDAISGTVPLNAFGMDSMMAMEVRNRLQVAFEIELPVLDLLHGATISELAARLHRQLGGEAPVPEDAAELPKTESESDLDLDDDVLVTAELERLLADAADEEIAMLIAEVATDGMGELDSQLRIAEEGKSS